MRSPDSMLAAKEAANALHTPNSLPAFLASLWMGVQITTQTLLGRKSSPAKNESAPSNHPIPGNVGLQPVTPDPIHSGSRTPAPAFIDRYAETLHAVWRDHDWSDVVEFIATLKRCWRENRQIFLCGNGGSAANAIHLANDFLYGIDKETGRGLRVTALPANAAVLTCLANDIAYEDIFAQQLTALAQRGDILIAFSGSGNSPNIVKALVRARELGVESFAVLGFTGGRALELADHPIYFPVHDMQVAEDLQMMVGHMAMQQLSQGRR